MTTKQQIATGFLATLIVCSVAFMPASADSNPAPITPAAKHSSPVVAAKARSADRSSGQAPKDLTYN
jgi:hypothetical protein